MDLTQSKPIIISAGIGGWYAKGIDRLERSLNFVGSPIPWKVWRDYPPNSLTHEQFPYYFKVAAFEWAISQGYTHALWADSAFWSVKSPMPIFDIINDQGFYCFRTGYNLAQTVNDRTLQILGLERDDIDGAIEWAGGFVGFNFENPDGAALYKLWKEYMDMGLSKGSREHDGQSSDPRFLHHRNDQSCFSLAMLKLGLENEYHTDHVAYYGSGYNPEEVIFFLQGI